MWIARCAFFDMPDVARSTFKGIKLGQAIEPWRSSKEPHGLSAPGATRRRGRRIGGAFVAHEPNSILEPQPRCGSRFEDWITSAPSSSPTGKVEFGESWQRYIA